MRGYVYIHIHIYTIRNRVYELEEERGKGRKKSFPREREWTGGLLRRARTRGICARASSVCRVYLREKCFFICELLQRLL